MTNELLGISGAKILNSDNYQSIVEKPVKTTLDKFNSFVVILFRGFAVDYQTMKAFAEKLSSRFVLDEVISWQAGDLIMIDNSRFLHGRRSFTDTRRRIFFSTKLSEIKINPENQL